MLELDGSLGEGGGQVLRSALTLAILTGRSFRLRRIRAGRPRPGLARQHLAALRAAAAVGAARVEGDALGATEVTFEPRAVVSGDHRFAVGGAGSATLVLQTVLLPLLTAPASSTLVIEGGTHNPWAPPFDFVDRVFAPLVARTSARLELKLDRHGFYPAGGGKLRARIDPAELLAPFAHERRGELFRVTATAIVAGLPAHIAERELRVVRRRLGLAARDCRLLELDPRRGPGNVVMVEVEGEHARELFTAFGDKGVRAETVAEIVAAETEAYLDLDVPVGPHLADQLLLLLAVAGGSFVTGELSSHARTHADVIRAFLPVDIEAVPLGDGRTQVVLRPGVAGA